MNTAARRFASLLLATLAAPTFVACVGDNDTVEPPTVEPAPTFAAASAFTRVRAISAAAGHDALIATELAAALPRFPEGGCPTVSSTETGVVYEGGCNLITGGRFEGRVIIEADQGDGRAFGVRFDQFSIETDGGLMAFDGHVIRAPLGQRMVVDLAAELDGIYAESRLDLDCSTNGRCVPSAGDTVEVEGLGEVTIEGEWSEGRLPSGELSLFAGDSLTIDFEGVCSAYRIDGELTSKYCVAAAPQVSIRNDLDVRNWCQDGRMIASARSMYEYSSLVHKRVIGTVSGTIGPIELADDVVELVAIDTTNAIYAWEGDVGACDGFVAADHVIDAYVDDDKVARRGLR